MIPSPRDTTPSSLATGPYFQIMCGGGTQLGVSELQVSTKKPISAKEFHNGMRKEAIYWVNKSDI